MAAEKLFQIDDRFEIENVGLVLVPGIPIEESEVVPGSHVKLKLPNGSSFVAKVAGVGTFSPVDKGKPSPNEKHLALGGGLTKSEVPVGTTVFKQQ